MQTHNEDTVIKLSGVTFKLSDFKCYCRDAGIRSIMLKNGMKIQITEAERDALQKHLMDECTQGFVEIRLKDLCPK